MVLAILLIATSGCAGSLFPPGLVEKVLLFLGSRRLSHVGLRGTMRILYKDCSRVHTVLPVQNPMSVLNMAMLSMTLTVAHTGMIPPNDTFAAELVLTRAVGMTTMLLAWPRPSYRKPGATTLSRKKSLGASCINSSSWSPTTEGVVVRAKGCFFLTLALPVSFPKVALGFGVWDLGS